MLLAHPSYATCPMKVQHISCSDGSRLSGRSSLVVPSPQPTQGGGDGVSSHHRAFVLRGYPRMPRSHLSPTAKPRVTPLYHYCSNFLFQLNSPVGLGEREREVICSKWVIEAVTQKCQQHPASPVGAKLCFSSPLAPQHDRNIGSWWHKSPQEPPSLLPVGHRESNIIKPQDAHNTEAPQHSTQARSCCLHHKPKAHRRGRA